jgi:long-subunit fatty acid transport protein
VDAGIQERGERSLSFVPRSLQKWPVVVASLVAILVPAVARAQAPSPTPPPPRLPFQDELDLQANAGVVQGSGARAFGMGGAFLARADDATAASWNPAGLSYLRQPELTIVLVDAHLGDEKTGPTGSLVENDQRHGQAPDFAAFTYPFSVGSTSGAAQLSFQRVLSFDSTRTIEEPDRTRHIDSSGGFDVLALGSGWQITRGLRVGATLNRWLNGYDQRVEVPAPREVPTRQNAEFHVSGWNLNFGVIWSPWEKLNLGAVFKTGLTADAHLQRSRVDFFNSSVDGSVIQTTNAYGRDDLTVRIPEAAGVGASWRPRSNLTLSLDYTRAHWSSGRITNFFTLPRTEPDQPPPVPKAPNDFFPVLPYPTLNDVDQRNTSQLRSGVEYVVIKNRIRWPIRVGYFTDGQYFRAATGEAPTFHAFTVGTGLIVGPFLFDVAYLHETGSYLSVDPADGALLNNSVKASRVFASVIYRHPRRP